MRLAVVHCLCLLVLSAVTKSIAAFSPTSTSGAMSSTVSRSSALAQKISQARMNSLPRRRMIGDVMQEQLRQSKISSSCFGRNCCPPPPLMSILYCSAINDGSDSESESSLDGTPIFSSASSESLQPTSWKEKLLKVSNYASVLCVLDCTVLPIVTVALPLFGLVTMTAAQSAWMHALGHQVALFFVLPVGFMATTTNYFYNHRKRWITAIGWCGLLAVFLANSGSGCGLGHMHHHHNHHHHAAASSVAWLSHTVGDALRTFLHTIHHGIAHRVTNLVGCALLITSNYISHQQQQENGACAHGPHCDHKH